jgi:DNA-binding transcriptional ArsR family regulator
VLQATASGANTGQLAKRIGISPATASHHATILRKAGLIRSQRQANEMLHEVTPLGAALLDANGG